MPFEATFTKKNHNICCKLEAMWPLRAKYAAAISSRGIRCFVVI